jgi:glyoxylase-like metal-dependent hydrolase (beta-lactamase superfamily II)
MARKTPTTAKKPSARKRPAQAPSTAKDREVAVRMYKLPLGDCFLLTFPTDDGGEFRMLIDCGLIQGAPDPEATMKAVAGDIARQATKLDLVLVTHEHWDHVSGFKQARDTFEKIAFEQLWLAWTEDPEDRLARKLRQQREARRLTLARTVRQLHREGEDEARQGVGMAETLLAFHGGLEAAASGATAEALDWVKDHAGAKNTRYCRPGEVLELPGVSAARVYVLGPPQDEELLHRSAPGRSHPETYLAPAEEQLRLVLEAAASPGEAPLAQPFDEDFRLDRPRAQENDFFQRRYGFGAGGEAWRRIDTDWQGLVGSLALQLDSDTNNTSLAVAIELLPGGQVLLFPGDAQVGNWLSWQDVEWPARPGEPRVATRDLLSRTVLYKVGHHGSHNATLREQGLEMMTSKGLLALIPVDEKFANDKKHWRMPWPDLLARLTERTGGRILRADLDAQEFPYARVGELFIDVPVPLGPA